MKKTLFISLATFLITAGLCLLFMILTACIPQTAIEENAARSAQYFYEIPLFEMSAGDLQNFKKDNYADCITAGIAYHLAGDNPYVSVMSADYNRVPGENVNVSFYRQMQGESVLVESYSRYWHGQAGMVRMLYLLMDVQHMRYVMTAVGIALHMAVALVLMRKKQIAMAVIYGLAFLLVNGIFALECFEYASVFLLMPAATLFLLHKRIAEHPEKVRLTFVVIGVLTAFFDFLTAETLTFTIPFTIYYIMVYNNKVAEIDSRKSWRMLLHSGVAWFGGYAGMFLLKWILSAVTLGWTAWDSAFGSVAERIGGEVSLTANVAGEKADMAERIQGIFTRNLGCLYWGDSDMQVQSVIIITIAVILVLAGFWYLAREKRISMRGMGVPAVVAAIPYVRFLMISNHSYIHYFFTYRAQMVTVLIILYLIYSTTFLSRLGRKSK